MFHLLIALTGVGLAQEPASPCATPASTSDLVGAMEVAENAWSMADAAGFQAATVSIGSLVPCINEPITRSTAARVHRVQGMNYFLQRDPERMQLAFAAARYVQPGWIWPADLVPADHPVQEQYVAKGIDNPALERTLMPKEGTSWFDGRETLDRPLDWPAIHQHVADDGSVQGTWLLWPGDTVPDYPRRAVNDKTARTEDPTKRGARAPMLIGAGAGYVVSGLLYGLAASSNAKYHDPQTQSVDDLDKYRKATNGRYWASIGFAGASTVTTVGAFAAARW